MKYQMHSLPASNADEAYQDINNLPSIRSGIYYQGKITPPRNLSVCQKTGAFTGWKPTEKKR